MKTELYKIRPLEWRVSKTPYSVTYSAGTGFGAYTIKRDREDWDEAKPWGPWKWGYCFDEYYDEYETEGNSLKECKRLASENWISRIIGSLEEVKS